MSRTYQTLGIVIKKTDWRENDSLFTIYTQRYGKLELHAAGCRKITSKLMGHLASYGLVDIMAARAKAWDKLAGARLIEKFDCDLARDYYYFNLIFEVLDKSVRESEPDEDVWRLVNQTIKWIGACSAVEDKQVAGWFFCLNLMQCLGYRPELELCAVCHEAAVEPAFSLYENSVVCGSCESANKINLPPELLKLIKTVLARRGLSEIILRRQVIKQLAAFIRVWLPYVLEYEIKTLKLI